MTLEVDAYPLDFDSLQKGDVVSVVKQESIFQIKSGSTEFAFASMALRERIVKELALLGRSVTVRHDKGAIVVCTDEDASQYNNRMRSRMLRNCGRAHKRNLQVDRSKLEPATLEKHDRANVVYGSVLSEAFKTRRKLMLKPAERTTPGLLGPEET